MTWLLRRLVQWCHRRRQRPEKAHRPLFGTLVKTDRRGE
jgi:hypothetical protein